jgi:hypothetical protein
VPLGPAAFECQISIKRVAMPGEASDERRSEAIVVGDRRSGAEQPDAIDLGRRLSERAQWPRHRRAAKKRDEIAPFHKVPPSAWRS